MADKSIQLEFRRSLGLSVSIALSFLGISEKYEGLDQWIYSTFSSLSEDLRQDIRAVFEPFGNVLLHNGLLQDPNEIETLPAFIGWINGLDSQRIDASNLVCLRNLAKHAGISNVLTEAAMLRDRKLLAHHLPELLQEFPHILPLVDRLVEILQDPQLMKSHFIYIITRFWDRHYRTVYAQCEEIERTSIRTLQSRKLPHDFRTTFRAITGREYPEDSAPSIDKVERAVMIPNCHSGPYAGVGSLYGDGRILTVVYNCRATGGGLLSHALPIEEMFPPLKALADETRLEILSILTEGEFYAQQIVDRMAISQSAVSRHLRLLVAGGVLLERRQEGMKFYRMNPKTLAQLEANLVALRKKTST